MPEGLNFTELNEFAPAWVPEPPGRGLSGLFQQRDIVKQVMLTSHQERGRSYTVVASHSHCVFLPPYT